MSMPSLSDIFPELVYLGIDCAVCFILVKSYSFCAETINHLSNAPAIKIDDHIQSNIRKHPLSIHFPDGNSVLPYSIVDGTVCTTGSSPIKSLYSKTVNEINGVIQSVSITEHYRNRNGFGYWLPSQRTINSFTNSIPFFLCGRRSSASQIEIKDWQQASKLELDVVYDQFEPTPPSLGTHLTGWFMGDIPQGIQRTEQMLLEGSPLVAIGSLKVDPEGKVIMMAPSNGLDYFLIKDGPTGLISSLRHKAWGLKIAIGIVALVGGVLTYICAKRLLLKWKAESRAASAAKVVAEARLNRQTRSQCENDTLTSGRECLVCLNNEREVIIFPCGHVCVCADCVRKIMSKPESVCPICRGLIQTIRPAYLV